jgi:hypothetical protein
MIDKLLLESVFVAVGLVIIGVTIHYIAVWLDVKHDMNDMKVYIGHLLIAGFLFHLIAELVGLNKWYCANGVVSKSN